MKFSQLLFISCFTFFSINVFSQTIDIKSLQSYPNNSQTKLPILLMGKNSNDKLTIEFDVKSEYQPNLIVVFRFCDKNWIPYDNLFLANQGQDRGYKFSASILPNTVEEANYHYKGRFPTKKDFVSFPYSGNWRFYITDFSDTTLVYAEGKFYVIYNEVSLFSSIKEERMEGTDLFPTDLNKVFNVTTKFILPEDFFPEYVAEVRIVENHKINYPYTIDRQFNTLKRQYYWDANRKFTFTARDIQPGNEYRQVNLMDVNRFNSKEVSAQYDGIEYSRFFQQGEQDLNGGEILRNFKNRYATYLDVEFSLRTPDDLYDDVYLIGAFNNWTIFDSYKMNKSDDLYTISIPLKRGIYDYQYAAAVGNSKGEIYYDWLVFEGNSFETSNEYHIFLYYNEPDLGGYDRIIGYSLSKSK